MLHDPGRLALVMALPVRLTTAVTPSSETSLILVPFGKAVFVAPPDSQSSGCVIRSLTSPFIRSPGLACSGTYTGSGTRYCPVGSKKYRLRSW